MPDTSVRWVSDDYFATMRIPLLSGRLLDKHDAADAPLAAVVNARWRSIGDPADIATFISVSVLLAVVAFLASLAPARNASRVDPMVALRYE